MKDETVYRFLELDASDEAADRYSRDATNEATPVHDVLRLRRAFLAGARWQEGRHIKSEKIGGNHEAE